jgi:hypothetical protein
MAETPLVCIFDTPTSVDETMITAYLLIGAIVQLICEVSRSVLTGQSIKKSEKDLFIALLFWPANYPLKRLPKK